MVDKRKPYNHWLCAYREATISATSYNNSSICSSVGGLIFTSTDASGAFMSNIVQFPSKKGFREQLYGKIPTQILDEMLVAYDRVLLLKNKYPNTSFHVASGYEQEAKDVVQEFENYSLILLNRILELEAELCMAKHT